MSNNKMLRYPFVILLFKFGAHVAQTYCYVALLYYKDECVCVCVLSVGRYYIGL